MEKYPLLETVLLFYYNKQNKNWQDEGSGGSSGWRSGDRHPLGIPIFHFSSTKTKKNGLYCLE